MLHCNLAAVVVRGFDQAGVQHNVMDGCMDCALSWSSVLYVGWAPRGGVDLGDGYENPTDILVIASKTVKKNDASDINSRL